MKTKEQVQKKLDELIANLKNINKSDDFIYALNMGQRMSLEWVLLE